MLKEVNADQILQSEQPTELEVSLAEFDKIVEQKKALDRLLVNEDFQTIIVSGYLEEDFDRLSNLLKNPSVNGKVVESRTIIVDKIVAKGLLENWLKSLVDTTQGLDNPEMRAELVREGQKLQEEAEALEAEEE